MEQIRIGVIGVTGRGGLAAHWHQPKGRSVVVAGADISTDLPWNISRKRSMQRPS
ncbi:MAG: hypothetical protein V1800_17550 [Candidatus Latescibacterota bacterium]